MKCIRSISEVVDRVPDRIAKLLVARGEWHYTSKGRWKAADRYRSEQTYQKATYKALDGWT